MEHVPVSMALNPDGKKFLHYRTSDFHIYYSENIIRKTVENGLDALIVDGIFFEMHPRDKDRQLYTIHGVCNVKIDVSLLFSKRGRARSFIEQYGRHPMMQRRGPHDGSLDYA